MSIVDGISSLEFNADVKDLGDMLVDHGPIAVNSRIDGYHIAAAAVHGVDYLLTWNCRHIANAFIRSQIEEICRGCGYEPPIICTPLELTEG